ncbi:hypothetical protein C1645_818318 [Glomus cerebriforme]|uniref:Uncharacterized protein n=1 Tax=Glomus cerebriforme TaxID=658196 RepID=A0A397TH83_9GLOM|nr:hypothetical protein C1645_818318 [Glomus cerebriforme]
MKYSDTMYWLIDISQTQGEKIKEQILIALISTLTPFASFSFFNKKTFIESDSNSTNTNIDNFNYTFTNISNNEKLIIAQLPNKLWNSHSDITAKKSSLKSSQTIQDYYNAFPDFLTSFFLGMIYKLQEKKIKINNLLIGLAFPFTKIWLSQILSSLVSLQIQLPINIDDDPEEIVELTANTPLFDHRCLGLSSNIIILEFENNPNSDKEILHNAEMYKKDFLLENYDFLDIVANKAIYHHLIKVLFLSYGLFSSVLYLGICFLNKFEFAVNYHSIIKILDLLWVAVRTAINIYINSKKIPFSEIMDNSLAAARPFFASAAKSNYTTAIAHFLASLVT